MVEVSEEAGQAMAGRIGAAAYLECSALLKEGVRATLHCSTVLHYVAALRLIQGEGGV